MTNGRVLHVVENLDDSYGGPAKSVPNLAASLRNHGWIAELYSVQWDRQEANEVIDRERLDWRKYPLVGPRRLCFSPALQRALKETSDHKTIIHLHNLWNGVALSAYIAAVRGNQPLVISPRGSLYDWSLAQGATRKKLAWTLFMRRALDSAGFLHATARDEAEAIRRRGVVAPIRVIPNGVESVPEERARALLASRLGKRDLPKQFLFLSRVHKKKGVDLLLDAWKSSGGGEAGHVLNVAGPFASLAYEEEIAAQARALGVGDSVKFYGMVRGEMRESLFREADVLVLPSHTENFGIVVCEAMARGLPVITTTGTPWRRISAEDTGWWIPLGRRELTEALIHVMESPRARLASMGERALRIAADYTWDAIGEQFAEAYKGLLHANEGFG